ncbi:phosphoinositide 3-kinase regulatory subunit 4 [Phlebotomus papatasi]|uniref:phosphoinositide 3-kinase regulatory subunit 4 n=1 Tax=Phlebotomus papatasi TaxID=29031 RepID=UPI0024836241|nr:phosphoinositide 3-kinase regulatory subunit 4 [Phlebotomus papatasi]
MGNQLVGIAPSQIFPVEHYLTGSFFESDLQYETSMGSTRFFKVARAKSDEGLVVIKVFVKHDPSLPLECHAEKLEFIKKNLSNAVNCLPFQRVVLTEKAGLIMREFVKHSLYDRVSTRPFLTATEKKWITFQVLCALHQCHKQKICHGDIKLENILITSWNWILLADFASFKPTFLPEDNPSDYTYFFDTSRRRTCYIAPERFIQSISNEAQPKDGPLVGDGPCYSGNLTPEMDIFSAGCALLELWCEGTAPFEFSQLLYYRKGDQELVTKHLNGIDNARLRNLIASMLNRNPAERKSAEIYLDQERGSLFPEYFYTFLQSYMQMFSSIPIMPLDDKIMRLHADIKQIIKMLTGVDPEERENSEKAQRIEEKSEKNGIDDDGLILVTTAVTANSRGLHYCNSKLCCLEILQDLAEYTTSEVILDRIIPTILYFTKDPTPRVRSTAIDTLTSCLRMVRRLPRSDGNVFPEYVFPIISGLATDTANGVRVALARNLGDLAEVSVRFLEQTRLNCPAEYHQVRYEREMTVLHDMVQLMTSSLLTDPQGIVKQTLIEADITKLCIFFGKNKAYDVILSHMITFLNDKEDKHLRGSFFECIVGVAAYVGWTCSEILMPLLQQGLTDTEEMVIAKAIRAMSALAELGLVEKPALVAFITEAACYMNHPNGWIRHEICGLIATATRTLTTLDVQCKIVPAIADNLTTSLILIDHTEILMDCLQPPIPRAVYDSVVKFPDVMHFFKALEERKEARARVADGLLPQYGGESGTAIRNLFRRLSAEGLTELAENQLLTMKSHIVKLNKYKAAEPKTLSDGRMTFTRKMGISHEVQLLEKQHKVDPSQGRKARKVDVDMTMNSEWQHMFGVLDINSVSPSSPSNESGTSVTGNSPPMVNTQVQPTPTSSLVEYSMPERSFLQERFSECRLDLESLQTKIKTEHSVMALNRDYDPFAYYAPIPPNWRLKGTLVAHLHEHRRAVTRLSPLKTFGSYFASTSVDGTVRLWDCNKLDGHQSINRSRQTYSANTPLYSLASCDAGQSLAVAGKDGTLLLLRIDPNSSKMALQQAIQFDPDPKYDKANIEASDGPVVDMQPLDQGAQSLIVYTTLYGGIVGWDIRAPGYAWRLQSDLKNGVITTLCVDPTSSWLAVGTSGGRHSFWDLRFKLPIAEIRHPHDARIRRIACHPTERSSIISASQGNNEVYIYNIETNHRQMALWTSTAPPLSNTNPSNHSAIALLPGISDKSEFLLTAGTDQRIRHWDLRDHTNCSLIVPSPKDHLSATNTSYEYRLIDGTKVIQEIDTRTQSTLSAHSGAAGLEVPRSGPEPPASGHIDIITDMVLCKSTKQTFVASSSRDGAIKIWK